MTALARYAAVFVLMMTNLMFELLLTRIFSATMWYHFAFMAVSVALFGTTVGAVVVHLFPRHFRPERMWSLASRYAVVYAGSVVVCTVGQLQLNATFGWSAMELATLAELYLLIALPFVLSGIFICVVLVGAETDFGALYCADLLGAGAGCALFVPFMAWAEGPRAVLVLGAVAAAAAAIAALSARDRRAAGIAVATALLCAATFAGRFEGEALAVRWVKGEVEVPHAFNKWNAFSHLTVDPYWVLPFGWGFGSRFDARKFPIEQEFLVIDGAAATVLTKFDGDFAKVGHLQWDVASLVHVVRPDGPILVIGVGGGRDLLAAVLFGHRQTVGVEVNGDIAELLRGPFADFTGRLAFRPDVTLVHDEARSYIAQGHQRFQVIQASLVDTWAAAANGAYVLSENALYTLDAFRVFLDQLTEDGILSVSRWYFKRQPGETYRLLALGAAALRQRAIAEPQQHLFLARSSSQALAVSTLLVSARPFSATDLEHLRRWGEEKGFEELLGPGHAASEIWQRLAGPAEPSDLFQSFVLDISPPTDDRPFFFNMLRVRDAFRRPPQTTEFIAANADAVVTVAWLFVIVLALSTVFILGPLWLREARRSAVPRARSRLLYFCSVGAGFILIELSQMQRLMISLGHPVYGLTVVLFSLLIAAGVGSWWTSYRAASAPFLTRALYVLLVVAIITAAVAYVLAPRLESAPTWVRVPVSVTLLVPLGFVLGLPLATGMALSVEDPPGYRALYWGINGAASVCGSVLATMTSLAFGITATYALGLCAYAVAAGAAHAAFRQR